LPLAIDIRSVQSKAGDYAPEQLGTALEPYLERIAHEIKEHADFRRILVFVPLIATSLKFVEVCKSAGINAAHIDGSSPDRKEILQRYAAGEIELLSNAMLLTEGFDDPGIDCVVVLRATRSRALYSQMVGRGTRIAPAKQNLLLLDFLWLHEKHNLIRPAHLVAQTDEQAEEITQLAQTKGGGESQEDLDLENLATEAQSQREEKLRAELEAKAKRKSRTLDAMEFCLSLHATDAADYEPATQSEAEAPTKSQLETLERNGFYPKDFKFKGHASKILELIYSRQRMNLATPKQLKYLKQFNYPNPETVTFEQASAFLDKRFQSRKEVTA
jgi:superfamily II DNA or RNA helicase